MTIAIKHGVFPAGDETIAYTQFNPERPTRRALCLHGAGKASKQRYFYLGEAGAAAGTGFFCFDFSGHGDSTNSISQSSLAKRCSEAEAAFQFMGEPHPSILIGTSMGGYIALEMLKVVQPEYLVLICPALYAARAFDVPFDQRFSDIIRAPDSFENNDILPRIASFSGNVLLLIGDQDDIIPARVMELYEQAFISAKIVKSVVIREAPHAIHAWAALSQENADTVTRIILDFISSD